MWKVRKEMRFTAWFAEDGVVDKLLTRRDLDWREGECLFDRQCGRLNPGQIREALASLLALKAAPESLDKQEWKLAKVDWRLSARL